jgi:hypothetical protein
VKSGGDKSRILREFLGSQLDYFSLDLLNGIGELLKPLLSSLFEWRPEYQAEQLRCGTTHNRHT